MLLPITSTQSDRLSGWPGEEEVVLDSYFRKADVNGLEN